MDITDVLQRSGLTKNEATLYYMLLKLGPCSASVLAKNSKIYRPYVYDTLGKLQEKGLVSSLTKKHTKHFEAVSPHHLLELEQQRMDNLKCIIPRLEELQSVSKEESTVSLYSGREVVRVIQKDVLRTLLQERGENLVIGVNEALFMEADKIVMQQFFNEMRRHNLTERVLVREGDTFKPAHRETTFYRFLPKEFFDPMSTFIYGGKVAILIFSQPLHGIIIESELLAKAYRKQFELLWLLAKET